MRDIFCPDSWAGLVRVCFGDSFALEARPVSYLRRVK